MSIPKSKIYTKTGDKGETSLFGGERVGKDNLRVEAYGAIDELNTGLGAALSFVKDKNISSVIKMVQIDLFEIGAELANPHKKAKNTKEIYSLGENKIRKIESTIDELDKNLPKLRNFILPGGTKAASLVQLSRSIARRAERRILSLSKKEPINFSLIVYMNRLSDLLFVVARYLNKKAKIKEPIWKK